MPENKYIKLNREALYNEIWEISVSGVAKKYNISYDRLRKLCKEMNIPIPESGYWTKLEFGKPVTKKPLPEFSTNEINFSKLESRSTKESNEVTFSDNNMSTLTIIAEDSSGKEVNKKSVIIKETHKFLSKNEYERLLKAAANIKVLSENKRLHRKIKSYKSVVKEWNKNDRKSEFSQRSYNYYSYNPPFLAGVISKESLPRVYRIIDTIYKKVEELGGSVNDNLSLQVRNEHVVLRITEAQDKVPHKVTKAEARALLIYEDERKHRSWAVKPQIRKWDYIFNGKLTISINGKRNIKDTDNTKIEDRLGDVLIKLYEQSEVVRNKRIEDERAQRKREEEKRLREENRFKYNKEVDKTIDLLNIAEDYDKACKIRKYISALESSGNCKEVEWIEWAKEKADWFDPTVARKDDLFGKRDHRKNAEEKTVKKIGRYW